MSDRTAASTIPYAQRTGKAYPCDFLAEFENAEPARTRPSAESPVFQARLHDLDRGLLGPDETGNSENADPTAQRGFYDDADDHEPLGPAVARIALAAGGFLLMIGVGAAAAALVFHDRVARILGR